MSATLRIRNELQAAIDLAQSLMSKAEEEKRELTAEERGSVDAQLAKARELRAQLTRTSEIDSMQSELRAMLQPSAPSAISAAQPAASWGAQFIASVAYDFIKSGHARGGAWATPSVELVAATLTEDPASGGRLLVPQYIPGVQTPPMMPPSVLDLLASGTTDAASIVYMVEKTFVNAAAAVAEGAPKPESTLTFDAVTDAVKKVATWLPVSEEMLADVGQIQNYIDNRLRQFVIAALEYQVLRGDGLAGAMLGILNRPGLAPPVVRGAEELNAIAIYRQIVEIMTVSMLMPDGIVLSPRAWADCVAATDDAGVFYGPGMFSGLPSPSLWGLPVALSIQLPTETDGLVGSFKQGAQLWRRNAITVQASNSHSDYFVRNLVAIRAEQRAALAVYRPSSFGLVTGLSVLGAPVVLGSRGRGSIGGARSGGALGEGDRGAHAEQMPADREREANGGSGRGGVRR